MSIPHDEISSFRDALYKLHKAPSKYDGERDIVDAIELAIPIIENIINLAPEAERSIIRLNIIKNISTLGDSFYVDVNPHLRTNTDYFGALGKQLDKLRGHNSIQLELGVSTRWTVEETDSFIKRERIGDVIRLDADPDVDSDLVASVTALPFSDESIDIISSNSLMEHVPYPHDIIKECFRVLRPGGIFIVAVPFHFVQHGFPEDHLRFTAQFFETVLHDAGFLEVNTDQYATSGAYYVAHQLLKGTIACGEAESQIGRAGVLAHLMCLTFLGAFTALDDHLVMGGASHWHSTHAFAIKPGKYTPSLKVIDRSLPFLERFKHLICPKSGLPVEQERGHLVSLDGKNRYPIINGKPNMFVMHGFGSSFLTRSSSRDALSKWKSSAPKLK